MPYLSTLYKCIVLPYKGQNCEIKDQDWVLCWCKNAIVPAFRTAVPTNSSLTQVGLGFKTLLLVAVLSSLL